MIVNSSIILWLILKRNGFLQCLGSIQFWCGSGSGSWILTGKNESGSGSKSGSGSRSCL